MSHVVKVVQAVVTSSLGLPDSKIKQCTDSVNETKLGADAETENCLSDESESGYQVLKLFDKSK